MNKFLYGLYPALHSPKYVCSFEVIWVFTMMALYDEMSMDDNTLGMYGESGTHWLYQPLPTQYGVAMGVRH